ncbi:MAG: hypothetical protein ABW199_10955 [Caulobacterales bacterium]
MKVALSAAFAAIAFGTVAFAETAPAPAAPAAIPPSRCGAIPPEPTLPDGAAARNAREMQTGDAAYQAWARQAQEALTCRRAEADELLPAARQHEARVSEYNAGVQRLNSVGQAWTAEAAEYNARNSRR